MGLFDEVDYSAYDQLAMLKRVARLLEGVGEELQGLSDDIEKLTDALLETEADRHVRLWGGR